MSHPSPFDLSGRRYLVTGASSGIGRETARLLAQLGASVCLNGRDAERLAGALALLEGSGHQVSAFDLDQTDQVPAWMKGLAAGFGTLHGAVHCAGIHELRPLRATTAASVERLLHTNVTSSVAIARAFRQKGVSEPPSSLILMSSVAGCVGQAGTAAYSASKGALNALARSLALELAGEGIRVNTIAPGIVNTELTERMFAGLLPEQKAAIEREHPLGFGTPLDVAAAVAFLLAPASRWITGTTLVIDGGYTAH